MNTLFTISEARKNLFGLVQEVNESHVPIFIHGKRGDAVLISKEDWDSFTETNYLSQGKNGERLRDSLNKPEFSEYSSMEELRREFEANTRKKSKK